MHTAIEWFENTKTIHQIKILKKKSQAITSYNLNPQTPVIQNWLN
jgi:hypothetical protein